MQLWFITNEITVKKIKFADTRTNTAPIWYIPPDIQRALQDTSPRFAGIKNEKSDQALTWVKLEPGYNTIGVTEEE